MKKSISIICALTGIAMLGVYCLIFKMGIRDIEFLRTSAPALSLLTVVLIAASFIAATVLTPFRSRPAKIMTVAGFAVLSLFLLMLIFGILLQKIIFGGVETLEIMIAMVEIAAALFVAAMIVTPFRHIAIKVPVIAIVCVPLYLLIYLCVIMLAMSMIFDFMYPVAVYSIFTVLAIFPFVPGTVMKIAQMAKIKKRKAA